jgi:hypothetical protein
MTKRTKKYVGTRRRKNRANYTKKTLRNKKNLRSESDEEYKNCPICMKPLKDKLTITTRCKHKFHVNCVKPICKSSSKSRSPKCPLCRNNISNTCESVL